MYSPNHYWKHSRKKTLQQWKARDSNPPHVNRHRHLLVWLKKNVSVCIWILKNCLPNYDWKENEIEALTLSITNKIIVVWVIFDFNENWNRVAAKRFMLIICFFFLLNNAMEYSITWFTTKLFYMTCTRKTLFFHSL